MKTQPVELPIATADGEFIARYSEKGLSEISFPKAKRNSSRAVKPRVVPAQILRWHNTTAKALKAILAGREPKTFPPLDLAGTVFQKNVWNALQKISLGKTKSYGEIATAIKNPKAVRAVGGACGANPVPILVPCHRVLAANKNSAASPAAWIGNAACSSAKELYFSVITSCKIQRAKKLEE